jgi:CheY-like chemotaxis protein
MEATIEQGAELSGLKILVVEDEPLIAMSLADLLRGFGCLVVGPALSLDQSMRLIRAEVIDGAILDVNLGSETVFPLADALAAQSIPFVYVTGYSNLLRPCDHGRPFLQKPYKALDLVRVVGQWRRQSDNGSLPYTSHP